MLDFYKVNFEVKIRQTCETIKNKDIVSCYYGGGLLKRCFLHGQFKLYNVNTMSKEILLK